MSTVEIMSVANVPLSGSVTIPQIGFGVFQVPPEDTQAAVEEALKTGYRHIDTARIYGNEAGVGAALAASDLAREDIFVTTKLWNSDQGYDSTLKAFDRSMDLLGLDVLDLYLIHWPTPAHDNYVDTWRALEKLQADGRVRAIGVSNFRIEDLERLAAEGLTKPSINQIEVHPYLVNAELRDYHDRHGVVTEAWSPLAKGEVLSEALIQQIARTHFKTSAQIVLAWHIALGHVVIPKSVTPSRIAENLDVLHIALSADEITAISALDQGRRTGPDPTEFN